ncbi:Apolipophorin [Araneus ventricosus]|uniref:Apolipophorin n=1 Tax=Araneus ventricosus TaxID=182803 RepID=A0A4Y2LD88_ARAVE|nr:Apolipophorin [Araneus ventricosus]
MPISNGIAIVDLIAIDISAEINHAHSYNNYRTRGAVQWAPSKRLAFNSEGNHELSGRRRICTINFEGSSPFRGFESTTAKMTYSNDGFTVNTDVETMWNRNKITSSLSMSRRNQMLNKNLEGKFSFTSPFRNYENVLVSTSFEMNDNSYKVNVDGQLPHRSTASLNSQGKMVSWNDIEVNAVVISNFPKYMNAQRVSLDLVHKVHNAKLRSTLDASYGNDRLTVVLIGLTESGYNSRNSEFSFTVNTPFRGFEEMKVDFGHNQRGYEYLTKLQMNKNKLSGSLTHKLNVRDALNFDTVLEMTSTSSLPNGKVSIVQASNGRQLEHTSFVEWDKNNKIHLNAQYLDKTFLKEFLVKLTTPFRNYKDMELKASLECTDMEHKGALSFVWDRRNKMTLSADISNYRWESLKSQVEFTSPFRGYEFYSTTVKYDLTGPQKEAEASFLWDVKNRKAVVAKGSFLYSSRLINIDMSLTTPFRDYERVILLGKYENKSPVQNVNILYERGWRRISFVGKTTLRSNDAEINIDFSSPYRSLSELSASAKYNKIRNGLRGEIATEWNRDNKYKASGEYELQSSSGKGSIEVLTPFRNFEKVNIDASGSYSSSKINSEFNAEWGNNKKIVFTYDLTKGQDEIVTSIKFQSPFADYREIIGKSSSKMKPNQYEHNVEMRFNQKDKYELSVFAKRGGSHYGEVHMNFNSPVSPLKDVQLLLTIDLNPELFQLISSLKWEQEKADIELLLNRKMGQFYEAKLKLNTPFESLKTLSFDSSLRNDRNQFMDGRLNIVTPFEILRNFNANGEFKNDDTGYLVNLKLDTPNKNINILGKLSNSQFQPFIASLQVDAPFASFRSLESNVELNIIRWNNARAKLTTKSALFSHGVDLQFLQDDGNLNFKVDTVSSALASGKAIASVTAGYKDLNRISTEVSVEVFGNVHYMNGQYKSSGKVSEVEMKVDSSILPDGKAGMTAKLSRRRNDRVLDGEINVNFGSSTHQMTTKYENKGNQISTNVKIDSDLLSFSTLESEAKYINSNGRDMEVSFSASTPYSSHSFTSSLKNYEGEKIAQLKIDCPMVSYLNPFTITSTFKHEGYSSMDLSLLVSTPGKEVRVAGNMKNEGWQNAEAFLTVNTPFEKLRMVRLDGRFSNDKFQNIDGNFQIETSNGNFPSLGVTSKLSRTEGSEEMSLMLKLPLRNYRSVQLLGNVHYNRDYSSADSRITFTLPQSKYVVYGQYGMSRSRISGRGEVEFNSKKWSATGRLERNSENQDVALSISTPSSQTYTFGGAYGNSGNRRHLAVSYSSPSNERYSWNSTLSYQNIGTFSLEFQAESPFYNYRSLTGSVNQQSNANSFSTNIEYTKNGRRGFLKVFHRNQRDGLKGSVQMGCPYTKVRDLKLSYSRVKKHTNIEDSLELDYNRAKQLKMEIILFGEKSSHIVLDVPALPLTVTADSKKISNGRELNFRSNYFSRVVSFRTSHQWDSRQIAHDAAFSWDERSEKRISYDFKLANTETGQELWSRIDTPLRSLMLKGNFTQTSQAGSGGIDFYWDAARSMEKHMAVGFVHADLSTDSQTSHKLEVVMEHPKLQKDIVQTSILTYSPNEFHLKSELQYSRDRHHNLLMELKASDLSRRDLHYKGEFLLKHPASRLDIRGAGEAMNSRLESSAYLRLNSLDRFQAPNVREVKAKIMKLKQEIEMMVSLEKWEVSNGLALGCEVLYNITVEQIENMYYSMYYSCLDFCEYMQKMHTEMMWKLERTLQSAQKFLSRAILTCRRGIREIKTTMNNAYSDIQIRTQLIFLKFERWLGSYAPCIIDGYYYTRQVADKIRYSINEISDGVACNAYYIALKNYAISVVNTFKALSDYEYTETAQMFLNRVYDINFVDSVLNHPTVDRMSEIANSVLRKSVEVYHNLGLDVVVAHAADTASNYLKTMALNAAQDYLSEFYQTKAGAKYDFEPQRGHIALELTLPVARNSLLEVFDYKSYPEYKQVMNINSMAMDYYEDFCIWDFYYKFMKYFTPSYWVPSFTAHALISGNQHFITFDKLSYDFAGRCSYLLARDFVDGNFTAIVNYGTEDHMRRSLTILVDGKKVDIGNDYKITLDNSKAELPIQIGKTVMIREGANVRVENEEKGFSVVCNFAHNFCSLSVSGFYFGKTAGLFGTFNYEPSLDMMSPSRYVMGDIESFTKSWEVGQAVCTSSENFATLPSNDYRVQKRCKDLFQKSASEFRACFKQVDPSAYLKMCISDLSAVHENDHEDAICQSAAAYFMECKMEGVPLKMPKRCVRCEKQDGSYMTEGEAIQYCDGVSTAADIVFLVEEKQCNKDRIRYLSKLADVIENVFRQKGYRDVRYKVVGFGGDEIHAAPHVHTMDGRESGPVRSLESAFQSLEFGDGPVNVLEAIRFAAGLTYRTGSDKRFILVKCSTCKTEEVKAEYSEMVRTLLDGDITLHLLTDQKYDMRIPNKNSKTRKVIGVDKMFAYTLKDVKDSQLSGDKDLLAQLRIPKDVCIPLAFEVDGSSFDAQFLAETKKNTNKKFMDVFARMVARPSLIDGVRDWGMCCECLATEDGVGKSTCQRCVSEEMASMISADLSGIQNQAPQPERRRSRVQKHKERRNGQ